MMRGQRSRLERSVDEMLQERDRVQSQIEAKFSELKSTAQVIANRAERERQSRQRKDLAIADEIGRQQHRGR